MNSSVKRLSHEQVLMVAVLLAGTLLAVLNQTLLSPALPSIMRDLSVDATTAQWLTSGDSLVEVVVIPSSAYLIGRFSTRQLFTGGLVAFCVGSALCAVAPPFGFMLLGRALQALCTGSIMAMVISIILLVFPIERRGFAMGLVNLIIGFAPAVGPSLAGALVDAIGWRPLFAIVTAIALLVIVLGLVAIKNYDAFESGTLDLPSVGLSAAGMVCLISGFSSFAGSTSKAAPIALIVVGAVLFGCFVRRQLTLEEPMLKISILSSPRYAVSASIAMISQVAMIGLSVIMPLYIQNVLGQSATASGMSMLPGSLLGAFTGLVSGRLFDRFGPRPIVLTGGALALAGVVGMCLLTADSSMAAVTVCYSIFLFGLMAVGTPLNTWGVNSLDNSVMQHANAVSNTLNQIGASFGSALIVSLTTLPGALNPGVSAAEQAFLGDHYAFIGVAIALACAFVVMLAFVRESFPARRAAKTNTVPAH